MTGSVSPGPRGPRDGRGLADRLDTILAGATRPAEPRPMVAGARCVVLRGGDVVVDLAAGHAQTHVDGVPLTVPRPVTHATRFDLASITKLMGTTAVAMALVDRGHLDVEAALGDLIPHVTAQARDQRLAEVTVTELLTHRGGLAAWEPLYLHASDPAGALARIADLPLRSEPGRERRYSDLSMMLVAEVLRTLSGLPLDRLFAERVAAPLGLDSARYGPIGSDDVAATSQGNPFEQRMIATGEPHRVEGDPRDFDGWRNHTLVGEVNDGNAHHAFGGIAGHAGLFATAADVARVGQAMLVGMEGVDQAWCGAGTVRRFLDRPEPLGAWGNRLAEVGCVGGFGHGGFTGVQLVVDVPRGLVVVLLTNRQHPFEPYPSIVPLWHQVLRACLGVIDAERP